MKSDEKVQKALEASQAFVDRVVSKCEKGTFSIQWYEKRNIEMYKEMLGQDKRKLNPELKELYQAI